VTDAAGPPAGPTARAASATAETYARYTLRIFDVLRSDPQMAQLMDRMHLGLHDHRDFTLYDANQLAAHIGRQQVNLIGTIASTAGYVRLWQRHKVVYRVHPGLAEELLETSTDTKIPAQVLRRLPHPDPFVVFPAPIPTTVKNPVEPLIHQPVIYGMLVTGRTSNGTPCSTADPALEILRVCLTAKLHYATLGETHEELELTIPVSDTIKTFTVDQLIATMNTMTWAATEDDELRTGYQLALAVLLYLCSDDRDEQTASTRPRKPKRGNKTQQPQQAQVIDLGYNIGPRLAAARHNSSASPSAATGTGVRPHLRRAHWQSYWTGPRGHQSAVMRWKHPIIVHAEERDAARATVIDVDRAQ